MNVFPVRSSNVTNISDPFLFNPAEIKLKIQKHLVTERRGFGIVSWLHSSRHEFVLQFVKIAL
jgi:hypothetical protein